MGEGKVKEIPGRSLTLQRPKPEMYGKFGKFGSSQYIMSLQGMKLK